MNWRSAAAWVLCGAALAAVVAGVALTVHSGRPVLAGDAATSWAVAAASGVVGAFLVTRHPGGRVGWLFVATAVPRAVTGLAEPWAEAAFRPAPGRAPLPYGDIAAYLQLCTVGVVIPVAGVLLAIFPTGRPAGRWTRAALGLAAGGLVLLGVALPALAWPMRGPWLAFDDVPDPAGPVAPIGTAVFAAGLALGVASILVAIASLIERGRREEGPVRGQILWFASGAAAALAVNLAADLTGLVAARPFGALLLLAGLGLAIFRYRLYDVDRLIARTLVYGVATLAAGLAYAALAVVAGMLAGTRSTPAIAAGAAFVVALLLRPLRTLSQDLIDRLFSRRAHSGAAILRTLARRVGQERISPETVADALRQALRDPLLQVYFPVPPSTLVDPSGLPADPYSTADGRTITEVHPRGDLVTVLVHRPAVTELRPRGDLVAVLVHSPADPLLLASVTRAAAVVLLDARLQAELLVTLAEVRASRARLAAAADAERRRIERDLHDGAQQRLVGLAVHIQSARRRAGAAPPADELLTFTVRELHAAVAEIRDLVHGVLPSPLVTGGLGPALADLARPGEVAVLAELDGRFAPVAEATAWFVACEGVANARRHAPGAPVVVRASATADQVTVTVADEGPGGARPAGDGLRNLRDPVEACGGTFEVASPAGAGTTLTAVLPRRAA